MEPMKHTQEELDKIAKDPEKSYYHARVRIEGPWKKGERVITKSAEWSYKYARDIIQGP